MCFMSREKAEKWSLAMWMRQFSPVQLSSVQILYTSASVSRVVRFGALFFSFRKVKNVAFVELNGLK